ncbi:Histidine kinase-, DNA gyrase B-, and HSP90-like ATPase [Lachnospiraceae bacterium NK3A20]|nr:Histidine kinase-, DNA gyrase B-, and HSP90-like ATPase [Lachnospiraceae bacterium NK3A20]
MKKFRSKWLGMPIAGKTQLFVSVLLIVMVAALAASMFVMNHSMERTGDILTDISRCSGAMSAMQEETAGFASYVKSPTPENAEKLQASAAKAHAAILALPYDYESIGAERYGKTWNIRNSYDNYEAARDEFTRMDTEAIGYVGKLYRVYDMQAYLSEYIQSLQQITVREESDEYALIYPLLQSAPYILLLISIAGLLLVVGFARTFSAALVDPLKKLAAAAGRMARGDYGERDVQVENRDELGELVTAFNSMRASTKENIETLKENQILSEKLHEEELSRVRTEKELDTARLDLLQSQINPHFLFNTLNTISGMAELEDADTTDQMIRSLSTIFRYNLHPTEQFIALSQELKVVEDYLYLQKMRFGERLTYRINVRDDVQPDNVMLPVFLLQPIVENAVTHGVTRKEEGGVVSLTVWMDHGNILITVEDTGTGVPKEKLEGIRRAIARPEGDAIDSDDLLQAGQAEAVRGTHVHEAELPEQGGGHKRMVGIGLGNVAKRIHRIYRNGEITIDSKEGTGTIVTLTLPQDENFESDADASLPNCHRCHKRPR